MEQIDEVQAHLAVIKAFAERDPTRKRPIRISAQGGAFTTGKVRLVLYAVSFAAPWCRIRCRSPMVLLSMRIQGLYAIANQCGGRRMSNRKIYSAIDAAAMVRRRRAHLPVGRHELCEYVTDLALAFHDVTSGKSDTKFLSYLLGMVVEEARHQSERAVEAESSSEASPDPDHQQD